MAGVERCVLPICTFALTEKLSAVRRRGGRVYVAGVGGSAPNASHCVNDLRKIAGIRAYCPTDNVAELTARTNDAECRGLAGRGCGIWLRNYLMTEDLTTDDAVLILSVGGGSLESSPWVRPALEYARQVGAMVLAIVSRDGGDAMRFPTVTVHIPPHDEALTTPVAEAMQGVVWHCVVNALREENAQCY